MAPADLRAEAEAIVARMSLDERVAAVSGRDWWTTVGCARLGVPSVWLSDGPHGLRKCKSSAVVGGGLSLTTEAHCYPTAVTLGSSFDVDLAEAVGDGIGAEARYRGVGVVLGPGVNLKRSPLCGRNFEYLSEDPYVSGALGAAWVRGCQRNAGIGASVKHFAANNQESNRMFCDSRVDARTLRELYLPAFEMVVKEAKPWTVMTAYNRVNGAYCSEHDWLLRRVLRDEWGFEGLVVSDWWAVRDRVKGVAAGMDLEMPTSHGIRRR
ncbi:scopolin beta-glucosidase [Aureococcus anophagefferens]|nr:scopolin beta-glucosidase [Aureococcus anophagefferens]